MLGSLFNKVVGLKVCNFFKNRLVFSVDIAKFLRIVFLYNTPGGCFWQSCHGTVKSARVPVLWFRSPKCIRFWSETFTKRCTNKTKQFRKQFLPNLNWLVRCFRLQNIFWKNNCFRFWWKTYAKRCTSNCVIHVSKDFLPCSLRLVSCFQFLVMIWKTEHGAGNRDFDFVVLLFTLLT